MSHAPRKKSKASTYLKAAFTTTGNIFVLIFSILVLPLLVAFGPGLLALLIIPLLEIVFLTMKLSSASFRTEVNNQEEAKEKALRDARIGKMLETMSPNQKSAYLELRALTDQTLACYGKLPAGGMLLASSQTQMNGMLDLFLKLMDALNGYRHYLATTDLDQIEKDLATLRSEMANVPIDQAETPLNRNKAKRIQMMEERIDRFTKAKAGREVISQQLATIDDSLRLFHDQALTLRDPDTANLQIESMTEQMEACDEAMRDLQSFSAVSESIYTMEAMDALPSIQTM